MCRLTPGRSGEEVKIQQHTLALHGGPPTVTSPLPTPWPRYSRAALAEVNRLVRAGKTYDYKHGSEIASFEQAFVDYHHTRYGLMVNSGTSALLSAYYGLDIGPGDEVICPDLTFVGSVTPLLLLGATPVLCDVDAHGNLDAAQLPSLISRRTR